MQNQIENNKEEEIEKNEEIIMVELQSKEIMRKNLKQLGKQAVARNRQLRNKQNKNMTYPKQR